jgi:hypothetical protein
VRSDRYERTPPEYGTLIKSDGGGEGMRRGRELLSKLTFGLVKPEIGETTRDRDLLAQRMRAENIQARAKRDENHRPPPQPPYTSP